MICNTCKKSLQGGFQADDGTFRCCNCLMIDINLNSIVSMTSDVATLTAEIANSRPHMGRQYKEQVSRIKGKVNTIKTLNEIIKRNIEETQLRLKDPDAMYKKNQEKAENEETIKKV